MENIFDTLKERGFVSQISNESEVRKLLSQPGATIYEGFDPSADSLHLGHLMSLIAMHHLQEAGHRIIFILGGGTGLVGDPTGKKEARRLLSPERVAKNGEAIRAQVEGMGLVRFHGKNAALMINNFDWLGSFRFLEDFILGPARFFSVNEMVKMRTFAERLGKEKPLSLMEFCYPVMQAWDFLWLFEKHNCRLQIGGQDQWANILQGIELIRREHGTEVFALTFPLLTTPSGKKMGKTEAGPLWLDPEKTSPFDFFQYLVSTPDALVPQMLRLFTFLPLKEIEEICSGHPRDAQRRLALEVTKIVHGEEEAEKARRDAERLFGKGEGTTESVPTFMLPEEGMLLDEILTESGALPSKSEVRRRCEAGAVRINEKKIDDPKMRIDSGCLIRYGRNRFLEVETN